MSDSTHGIAATDRNEIIVTDDDWASIRYIETPHQQNSFPDISDSDIENTKIQEVFSWGTHYVVQQHGKVFFSPKNSIHWQPFPVRLINLTRDLISKNLYGVTEGLTVVVFLSSSLLVQP